MYEFFCYKFPFKNKERPANASFMPAKLCAVLPVPICMEYYLARSFRFS